MKHLLLVAVVGLSLLAPAVAIAPSGCFNDVDNICAPAPQGATAVCRDGSYSFGQHRTATCSRQGGVLRWLRAGG
jgi:hypothetical protein